LTAVWHLLIVVQLFGLLFDPQDEDSMILGRLVNFYGLHGITCQKPEFFMVNAMRTSILKHLVFDD
jgi:hypothetical protein